MKITLRISVALLTGCIAAVALALAAAFLGRTLWPEYAVAEPKKAYSLAMLAWRLSVGALCVAGAAYVATIIARDNGKAAWWLGGLFLAVSLPQHLFRVWADYPAWYHVAYLSYLVPIAGMTGRIAYHCSGGNAGHRNSPVQA